MYTPARTRVRLIHVVPLYMPPVTNIVSPPKNKTFRKPHQETPPCSPSDTRYRGDLRQDENGTGWALETGK